jgi:hypothetical protein
MAVILNASTSTGFVQSADTSGVISLQTNGTEALKIDSSGNVLVTTPSGLGYGTGSGGTVTQGAGSGKATAVTLNRPTGRITMDNAALASAATISFFLNNSDIASTDTIIVHPSSGSSAAVNYIVFVGAVAAGSCQICVRNNTAGSLSEALVLNFAVIKGVTA